jgi:hypothetical protein
MAESIRGLNLHCNKLLGMNSFIAIETSRLHGHVQFLISRLIRVVKVACTGIVTLGPGKF